MALHLPWGQIILEWTVYLMAICFDFAVISDGHQCFGGPVFNTNNSNMTVT